MNQLDLGNSIGMHSSKQSNWAHLPGDIGRRIRFKQLQAKLQAALDARPKAEVDMDWSQVRVEFAIGDPDERSIALAEEFGHDAYKGCSLIYDWEEDRYEWFEDDNAYGISTYREADGNVYEVDNYTAKFGYPNALKMTIMRVMGQA